MWVEGASVPIGDPSGAAPNPETMLAVAHPEYWASQVAELQDVLVASVSPAERDCNSGTSHLKVRIDSLFRQESWKRSTAL